MAGEVWDWPNEQVVRVDGSGPGINTPTGLPSDVVVTYSHDGRSYEFLLKTTGGAPVLGRTVIWEYGDGSTWSPGMASHVPVGKTYAAAGTYAVRAHVDTMTRSLRLVVV
jgi:hypothetical protein